MKTLILLSWLLASGFTAALPSEQHVSANLAVAIKPTVLKKLEPQYNPNATRALYMWGPYKLPPSNAKHSAVGFGLGGIKLDPNSDTVGGSIEPPCKDCTVHYAMANFAYKDGKQADVANGVYQHHIIVADFSGKSQIVPALLPPRCPKGGIISPIPIMPAAPKNGNTGSTSHMASHSPQKRQMGGFSVFVGGGGSTGSGNPFSPRAGSKVKSGYWIGKGGTMQLTSELVNYDPVEKEIYLTMDIEWSPGKDPEMLDVGMAAFTADSCDDKEKGFKYPPKDKPIVYKGEKWTMQEGGYFINFSPHVHDGAVNIKVLINDKEVCEVKVIYGTEGGTTKALDGKEWQTIAGYSPCEGPFQVKKGDTLQMTSEYDLTKYRLRPSSAHADMEAEAMAMANYIFAKPFSKGWFGWR